jgi:hypothetical protein
VLAVVDDVEAVLYLRGNHFGHRLADSAGQVRRVMKEAVVPREQFADQAHRARQAADMRRDDALLASIH